MEDIYDRSKWPSPDDNPLVQMLLRRDEWYSNKEIITALGLQKDRRLMGARTILERQIEDKDTAFKEGDTLSVGKHHGLGYWGQRRVFSRKALVIAAMRTNTVNAAAFRDWLATSIAEDFANG